MKGWHTVILAALGVGTLLYGVAVGTLWARQDSFIFPQSVNALPAPDPVRDDYKVLAVEVAPGLTLQGLQAPAKPIGPSPTLVVAFPGNAHDVTGLVLYLKHTVWPNQNVVVAGFAYRGYPGAATGQNPGEPSQAALLADAQVQVKALRETLQPGRVIYLGYSLGSAVAAGTAAAAPPDALVLVAPFSSMSDLAHANYRWLPTPLLESLLRHPFPTSEWLRVGAAPVWLAHAGNDGIIPPQQAETLRQAAGPKLQGAEVLAGADHISIVEDPRLVKWLRGVLERP